MKPNHLFLHISLIAFANLIAGQTQGAIVQAYDYLTFDPNDNSYIVPSWSNHGSISRNNVDFVTSNGGLLLQSWENATSATAADGGITLWGNPIRILLESFVGNANAASFEVSRGSNWMSYPATPIFKIDANTLNSTFTGSNVSINGGSLSVGGSLSAGGSPVLTSTTAAGVLTGQNFVQLGSGGVLNISSTTASSSSTTGAITVAGGIGVAKDSYINGIRLGKGSGSISNNTTFGISSLGNNTTGTYNTSMGSAALMRNTTGNNNSSFGTDSLHYNTTGIWNTAVGALALYANNGSSNVAVGVSALCWQGAGSNNTAVGTSAARRKADGTELTALNNSTFIGAATLASANSDTNSIVIGAYAVGAGSNTTVIGNSSTTHTYLKGETNTPSLRVTASTVLEGNTVLEGQVTMAEAQGDISMGDYQ